MLCLPRIITIVKSVFSNKAEKVLIFEVLIPTLVDDNNLVQRLISMSLSQFLCHVSVRVTCPRELSRSL